MSKCWRLTRPVDPMCVSLSVLVLVTDRGAGVAETCADQVISRVHNRRRLVPAGSEAVCRETKEPRREPEEAGRGAGRG